MKKLLLLSLMLMAVAAGAQSPKTAKFLAGSRLLVKTMFETRDSATLESLFAPGMTHTTFAGKIENREEAIRNIVHHPSKLAQANMRVGYGVTPGKDSTTVRYFYRGTESKPDGTSGLYTVNLVMVWTKQKKDVKLLRLETLKVN